MSNINSAYFIHIMPKIGGAKAPSAPPVPTPMKHYCVGAVRIPEKKRAA